jgi:hypothetical protein
LRYGDERRAKVFFRDGGEPESLSFTEFRQQYTLTPDEIRRLGSDHATAFPDVSHAVVEYPLPLLHNGVELVDSPGLNDDEELDQLALAYVQECEAVLFVLNATQLLTNDERLYLRNHLAGRGKTIFYLINRWDQVAGQLTINEPAAIALAEAKLRNEAKLGLAAFFQDPVAGAYDDRVFELSSLSALRRRLTDPNASLDGTGFPPFLHALTSFLEYQRLQAEIRSVRAVAHAAYRAVHEKVEQRIPLLADSVNELRAKIAAVEPEFNRLQAIERTFERDIIQTGEAESVAIADSLRSYILGLSSSFDTDFVEYQPELKLTAFLRKSGRDEFKQTLEEAFNAYLRGKMTAWRNLAEQRLHSTFRALAERGSQYGQSYAAISATITQKLTGIAPVSIAATEQGDAPAWTRVLAGAVAVITGDFAGGAMAASGAFTWKNIAANLAGIILVNAGLYVAFGAVLGPVGIALAALGFGMLSANRRKKEAVRHLRTELERQLPQIAAQLWQPASVGVKETFEEFRHSVVGSITADIENQKRALLNLLDRKEKVELDREQEIVRLRAFETSLLERSSAIEEAEQQFIGTAEQG